MSSRGLFQGKPNAFIAPLVIAIILVSGLSGALIGSMFRDSGRNDETPADPTDDTVYEPRDVEFQWRPFAEYQEYDVNFTLNAPQYSLEQNLSNVINLQSFSFLSDYARNAIADHYFVAIPSDSTLFSNIYRQNYDYEWPSFVTSDSVLHAYHVLFDLALRRIEETHFMNRIGNLSRHMVETSLGQYMRLSDPRWKDYAKKNTAFFSTAAKLHDPNWTCPDLVEDWVDAVLSLIDNAAGFSKDWFMNQRVDFTQFIPRGHYTESDSSKRFFRIMIWLARVAFRLEPDDVWLSEHDNREKGRNETAQAILMCRAFQMPSSFFIDLTSPLRLWQEIYDTTSFFVSTSDDLTPDEYISIIDEVYDDPRNLTELCDSTRLGTFIATAKEAEGPRIISGFVWDYQSINVTKGMRFMGQRFIPDSYMFSELTHMQVPWRLMPKALDIMAVLGSDRAWEHLDDQKEYLNYSEQIDTLKEQYGNLSQDEWTQSLYWAWLYSFKSLLENPEEGNPSFMLSEPWLDKQLTTSLGTWTELRHDSILYAKQSYTQYFLEVVPPPGYVEPVPKLYARLASLCRMMLDGLSARGIIVEDITDRLVSLHDLLRQLQTISEKQLSAIPLDATEWYLLEHIGRELSYIEGTYHDGGRAALVADVHTDPVNGLVLHEATGNPMVIFVAVPTEEGEVFLARGAMYSHYEFTLPMSERLTNEDWWAMLESDEAPQMAEWMGSFVLGMGDSPMQFSSEQVLNLVEIGQDASSQPQAPSLLLLTNAALLGIRREHELLYLCSASMCGECTSAAIYHERIHTGGYDSRMRELGSDFFARPTDIVARDLLGKILSKDGLSGRIVETEAYMDEPGSHAHMGNKTPRNEVMFGPPGHIYVYFIYGMHYMLNFVCEEEGTPGAVLIRAVEPLGGKDKMVENRGKSENLTNGPARVTQAFGINASHNGQEIGEKIKVFDIGEKPKNIHTTTRVGLSEGEGLLLRYCIQGNDWVSRK